MKTNRIHQTHTGKGNKGTSNVISGLKIRKSSSICALQNELEFLRNAIARIFCHLKGEEYLAKIEREEKPLDLPEDTYRLLQDIIGTYINRVSAGAYFQFQNEDFKCDEQLLSRIQASLKRLKEETGECPDFLISEDEFILDCDNARIQARKAEQHFWSAVDEIYDQHDKQDENKLDNSVITSTAEFLNLLSDFLFEITRYLGSQIEKEERYWGDDSST